MCWLLSFNMWKNVRYSGNNNCCTHCPDHSTANITFEDCAKNPRQEFFFTYKLDSDNIIRLIDTYMTHLTLKCFVPNSHLDKRTGFTAALLCRLLENDKRGALADLPHSGTQYRRISNRWHNYTQTRSSASWGSVSSTQCWKSLQFKGRDVTTRFDKQGCRQGGYQGDCRAFVCSAF